jgi:hypothetical protein
MGVIKQTLEGTLAIVRCLDHRPVVPLKDGHEFSNDPATPVGAGGVVCGEAGCEAAGLVWLEVAEREKYDFVQTRVFEVGGKHAAKVRVG